MNKYRINFLVFGIILLHLAGCKSTQNSFLSSKVESNSNSTNLSVESSKYSYPENLTISEEVIVYYEKTLPLSSHVFCWQNEVDEWLCGTFPHVGSAKSFGIDDMLNMMDNYSCSLKDMAILLNTIDVPSPETYYIVEAIYFATDYDFSMWYAHDLDKISTNKYLYEQLGLLEQYNRIISSSK